jgi:hypothetical protein
MANGSAVEFDSILRSFNDEQLMCPSDGKPVTQQQQQQIQSKKAAAAASPIQER